MPFLLHVQHLQIMRFSHSPYHLPNTQSNFSLPPLPRPEHAMLLSWVDAGEVGPVAGVDDGPWGKAEHML